MPQAETVRKEPNLKHITEAEIDELLLRVGKLYDEGSVDEADEVIKEIPLHWKSAQLIKELVGIDTLINSGTNLSAAVEHFGVAWLER